MQIGDVVRTPEGWEPIILMMHRSTEASVYIRLSAGLDSGPLVSTALSPTHNLLVNHSEVDAHSVVVGDLVSTAEGVLPVRSVQWRSEAGLYHIMVPSGRYFADGVAVSDFVNAGDIPRLSWDAMRAYATLRYRMGVPMHSYVVDCYTLQLCMMFDIDWFARAVGSWTGTDAWSPESHVLLRHAALTSAIVGEIVDAALTAARNAVAVGWRQEVHAGTCFRPPT